ncbi:MAG: hypothetical protein Q8784_02365 [Vigna little leaf phytoplasma]|nr:hypothetical protein [Vigna little leaf phytoplasma]
MIAICPPSLITSIVDWLNDLTSFLDSNDFDNLIEQLLSKGEFSSRELEEIGIQTIDLNNKIITNQTKEAVKNYIKKNK